MGEIQIAAIFLRHVLERLAQRATEGHHGCLSIRIKHMEEIGVLTRPERRRFNRNYSALSKAVHGGNVQQCKMARILRESGPMVAKLRAACSELTMEGATC